MNSSKKTGAFQPQTLDVDETIFDKNLKIIDDNELDDNISGLFPGMTKNENASAAQKYKMQRKLLPQDEYPTVQVTPTPGMCIKTKNVKDEKVFINLCKIQEIPPAPPLSEDKLKDIIASEDYSADFRVPMSLGAPREEKDKSGGKCLASDVAINSIWYEETMANSIAFTTFVINVAMEGLCEKYGDEANLDRQNWVILKNKKYLGTLQRHHIQQRGGTKGSKIEEIAPENSQSHNGHHIQNTNSNPLKSKEPQFTIFKEPLLLDIPDNLVVNIELPGINTKKDISLDIGEDRLVCEAKSNTQHYILDIFIPYRLNQERCEAKFIKDQSSLTLKIYIL